MGNFIKATITKNEVGAEHEGFIFTRFLTLEINNNLSIEVCDVEAISGDLQVGETHEFLLYLRLPVATDPLQIVDKLEKDIIWHGQVLAVNWIPDRNFSYCILSLYLGRSWLLVETAVGNYF